MFVGIGDPVLGPGSSRYYPPPYYYPPPAYYPPPPPVVYAPPPQTYAAPHAGGCRADVLRRPYVCPMDRPVATGGRLLLPGQWRPATSGAGRTDGDGPRPAHPSHRHRGDPDGSNSERTASAHRPRRPPIEDYALIGDCHTAALVSKAGSIDWLCWPRFDSPACFAALLGSPDNGRWRIAPAETPTRVNRRYRPGTMILETLFETASGSVALIDFMAVEKELRSSASSKAAPARWRCSSICRCASNTDRRCPG